MKITISWGGQHFWYRERSKFIKGNFSVGGNK